MPVPKHQKEWRTAAKANDQADIDAKEQRFMAALGQLHQPQADAANNLKSWYVATTEALTKYPVVTPQDVFDITLWVGALRVNLGNPDVNQLHRVITPLHAPNAQSAASTARDAVDAWIAELPGQDRTVTRVSQRVAALAAAGFSPSRRRAVWADVGGPMGNGALNQILAIDPLPDWLDKVSRHSRECAGRQDPFWLQGIQGDLARIQALAPRVYADAAWENDSARTNAAAKDWVAIQHPTQDWLQLFTMTQWLQLQSTIQDQAQAVAQVLPKLCAVADNIPANHKNRDNPGQVTPATLPDLGAWLHHHREVVCELLVADYPADVVAEMYAQELEHREIVATTWFRKEPVIVDAKNIVGFKTNHGAHGFVFANARHLAERHLYQHFDFTHQPAYPGDHAIKAENSFHPRGTTQGDLAALHGGQAFVVGNGAGVVTVDGYKIAKRLVPPNDLRIAALFPDIPHGHRDYFTRDKLERIRDVAARFPNPYKCENQALEFRPAPRGRR